MFEFSLKQCHLSWRHCREVESRHLNFKSFFLKTFRDIGKNGSKNKVAPLCVILHLSELQLVQYEFTVCASNEKPLWFYKSKLRLRKEVVSFVFNDAPVEETK